MKRKKLPWDFLQDFRGKIFSGEWPTFPEMLEISVARWSNRACFTDFDGPENSKQTFSYSQVHQKVLQLKDALFALGIKKGDAIAVTGKNSPEWAIAYLAIVSAAAIVVPLDNALHENEVQILLKTARPKIVFSDEEKFEWLSQKKSELGFLLFSLDRKKSSAKENFIYNLDAKKIAENFSDFEAFKNSQPKPVSSDTAAILFTSGTTGHPKGVMLSHENLIADGFIAQTRLDIFSTDVFYALLPIHHAYTMQAAFICPLEVGAEIVFGKSMAVTRLMSELKNGKISVMLGVPVLYNKLLAGILKGIREKGEALAILMAFLRGFSYLTKKIFRINIGKKLFAPVLRQANLSTLRVAICGGGPLSKRVFKIYNEMGIDFIQGYGLTETSPIIVLNPIEHFKISSVGAEFTGFEELKILNPDKNGIGEIAVKGPMVMQGYFEMPEETAKMFTADGFFKTGDLGKLDSERYLVLCGRAKNLIVTSGGKNVYPEEIEDAFQTCENVKQIVVRAYTENQENGEEIEAAIYPSDELLERLGVLRSDSANSEKVLDEIKKDVSAVNKTLAAYAKIKKITILTAPFEMTTTLKVKR